MTTLIVGASGATGRLVVAELLAQGQQVRAVVRRRNALPAEVLADAKLTVIEAAILDLSDAQMAVHVQGCDAVVCCLGHNMTCRGIFGAPRRLVTQAIRRLHKAVRANSPDRVVKFVLMNSTGVRNPDRDAPASFGERVVIGLLRALLPPHTDNEQAAAYLRDVLGHDDDVVEWVAVRPDGLIDAPVVTPYTVHPSPTCSAIFDSGKTSRVNVAHFMASLVVQVDLWATWRGQAPVIYNAA